MILAQQLVHSVLEPATNKVLQYDPQAKMKLAKLEGNSFAVSLTDLSIQVVLSVTSGEIRFSSHIETPSCYIKTSSNYLKQLSDASQLTKLIKQDQLILEGDLNIAQSFSSLFLDNDINWQQMLSRYVGDGMAYRIHHGLLQLQKIVQQKLADFDLTVQSALVDEIKVTPSIYEVEEYINQVDDIHARTEQLSAVIASLRS